MLTYLAAAISKSLLLKMSATVMTVEFGIIHHYFSVEEKCLFVRFFEQVKTLTEQSYANYNILV